MSSGVNMRKTFLIFLFLPLLLTTAMPWKPEPDIPASARRTIQEDYLEWIHPPRLAGPCEDLPVVKVEWIAPRGLSSRRPVVWLKVDNKFAAILGLSDSQAEWIGGIVSAQPLMVLRDVSIYRLCRMYDGPPW